jgi:AcrR family transcriptional regulator
LAIDRIIAEVGVTKTPFYNHFESKDDLIIEAIRRHDDWELALWTKLLSEHADDDPRQMILSLFDTLDGWFNLPDFQGCPFINAAAEFPSPSDPIHQAAARHKRAVEQLLGDAAAKAGAQRPRILARKLMVLFEGAITVRQVGLDEQAAATARSMVDAILAEHLSEALAR